MPGPLSTVGPLKGLSLQHRIPLLISLLLCIVVTVFVLTSYWSISTIEYAAGKQRLQSLSEQIKQIITESMEGLEKEIGAVASSPEIEEYIQNKSAANTARAVAVLDKFAGASADEYAYLANLDMHPDLVSRNKTASINKNQLHLPPIKNTDYKASNIYQVGDDIYFALIAPVNINGVTKAYLVRCREVRVANKVLKEYTRLAGQGLSILFGNTDGSLWTNLYHALPYRLSSAATKAGQVYEYQSSQNQSMLGAFQNISGTPWQVVVEANRSLTVQRASLYLKWMIGIGIAIIIAFALAAGYLGKKLTTPLRELISSVNAVAAGDKSSYIPIHRTDEVGTLALSFNTMLRQLDAATTAMQQEMQASETLNEQLRRLSSHVDTAREEERSSIARDLHDEMGQVLTGLKMDLFLIKKRLSAAKLPEVNEKIGAMDQGIDEGIRFVRKLSSELRAGPLEDLGLYAAISWYAKVYTERFGIPVELKATQSDFPLPVQVATAVFRILQESLTNVARHANATRVEVTISEVDHWLQLRIKDNGKGFVTQENKTPQTLGLLGMKERALKIHAKLNILSAPGKGCEVVLSVPMTVGEPRAIMQG